MMLVLLGLGVFSLAEAPAQANVATYKSFQDWCLNYSRITRAQQQTLDMLLDEANTQNCQTAQSYLSQLNALSLVQKNISDVSPLASLPNLKFLIISFTNVEDVSALANLTQLQNLILESNEIQDLSSLQKLSQLKSLIALNNPLISKRCPVFPVTTCVFSDDGASLVKEALALNEQGGFAQSRTVFHQAKELYEQQDNPMRLADVVNHLANLDLKIGRYADAIAGYETAIALRRELGDFPGIGISLVQQSKAFEQLGLFEQSEDKLILATENAERQWQLGIPLEGGLYELPKDTGALYRNLAIVQNRLGKFQAALKSAQFSLKNYNHLPDDYAGKRVGIQTTLAVLGQTYHNLELWSRGQATLKQALAMARTHGDREGMGQILSILGEQALQDSQSQAALAYLQEATDLQKTLGNQPDLGKALHQLGMAHLRLGHSKKAIKTFLAAIEIWESLRPGLTDENKVALVDTQLATYEQLQVALMDRSKKKDALEISERGRARAFAELIASQFEGETHEQFNQAHPPSIKEIRAIAKQQNATLVEYSIVDSTLIIWVIQPSGQISVRTKDLAELSQSIDTASERARLAAKTGSVRGLSEKTERAIADVVQANRDALLDRDESKTRGPISPGDSESPIRKRNHRLRSTYKLLIEPIADLLPNDPDDKVVIVPQGPLFLVPFAALQDDAGQYLIEKHTLMISPAISVLGLTQQISAQRQAGRAKQETALIVGNPSMPSIPLAYGDDPVKLSPLPGAESEAIAIASLLDVEPMLGHEATESEVIERMKSAQVVHLATHGLLDELQHMEIKVPGAIALTPAGQSSHRDGLLTSEEILQMDLNTDLVVLSACNTGRGKITGDGVVGLSRSFISAGAPSVVVSLWAVPDAPTAVLMQAFYQHLQAEPNKAKALRLAMLETMKDFPKPQDWAAFLLIGDSTQVAGGVFAQ